MTAINPTIRRLAKAVSLASIVACVAAGTSQAGTTATVQAAVDRAGAYPPPRAKPGPVYPDAIGRALRAEQQRAKRSTAKPGQTKAAKPERQFDDWFRDPPTMNCTGSTRDDWFRDRACGR